MSMRDYLHEKAEESRHNEVLAYLMFIAGVIFFVGGILATVTTNPVPDWFLFFPYQIASEPLGMLGLAFTLSGISLLVFGIGMGLYYAHDRVWYMKELYKANSMQANSTGGKKQKRPRNSIKTSSV
ncbi:MAG TPA: hypothetical protein VK487_05500 [Candidatus Bathyarchaeia archaeon]|nr:hypothetical protein [Candidatus Bathyarchaeia archaeon]